MPGREKGPEDLAEDILEQADADIGTEDLLRGTEVYEEEANFDEEEDSGVPELDFEPREDHVSLEDNFQDHVEEF